MYVVVYSDIRVLWLLSFCFIVCKIMYPYYTVILCVFSSLPPYNAPTKRWRTTPILPFVEIMPSAQTCSGLSYIKVTYVKLRTYFNVLIITDAYYVN